MDRKRRGADHGGCCRVGGTRAQVQQPDTAGKRILTAYFSKTGTTREAAQRIQAVAGGDLFEIRTAAAYPSGYQATVDQARRELDANARPALASRVENMNDYDIILVGFPIWLAYHNLIQFVREASDSVQKIRAVITTALNLMIPNCTNSRTGSQNVYGDCINPGSHNSAFLEGKQPAYF